MSVPYEKIVAEDLRLGHNDETVQVTMPGGGTATGTPINLSTFQDSDGVAFATLPSAALGKGTVYTVNDSTTKTQGAAIAGGGAFFVLAWSNGTNWLVMVGY